MSLSLQINLDASRSASPAPGATPQSGGSVAKVQVHLTPDPTPKQESQSRVRGFTLNALNKIGAERAAKLANSSGRVFFPDDGALFKDRYYINLLNFKEGDLPFALATCNALRDLKRRENAALDTLRHPTSKCVRNGVYVLALVLAVAAVTLFLSNTQAWIDGAVYPQVATGGIYAAKAVSSSGTVLSLGYNLYTKKKIEGAQTDRADTHGQIAVIYDVLKARMTDKARDLCAHFVEVTPFLGSPSEISEHAIKKLYSVSEWRSMQQARAEIFKLVADWKNSGRAAFVEKAMQELFLVDSHDPKKVFRLIEDFDLAVAAVAAYIQTSDDDAEDEKPASERVRQRIGASVKNPWNGVINDARKAQETEILHLLDLRDKKEAEQQSRLLSRAFVAEVADRPADQADPRALTAFVEGSVLVDRKEPSHGRKASGSLKQLQEHHHLRKLSSASGPRSRRDSFLLAVPEDADLQSSSATVRNVRAKSFGGTLSRPDSLVDGDGDPLGDFFSSTGVELTGAGTLNLGSRANSRRPSTASFDPLDEVRAKVANRSKTPSRNPSVELTPRGLPMRPASVAAAVQKAKPASRAPSADLRRLADEVMAQSQPAEFVLDMPVD